MRREEWIGGVNVGHFWDAIGEYLLVMSPQNVNKSKELYFYMQIGRRDLI